MRSLSELNSELRKINQEIDHQNVGPKQLALIARKLAWVEMKLQAVRSLLEARVFQAEIDNAERELKPK